MSFPILDEIHKIKETIFRKPIYFRQINWYSFIKNNQINRCFRNCIISWGRSTWNLHCSEKYHQHRVTRSLYQKTLIFFHFKRYFHFVRKWYCMLLRHYSYITKVSNELNRYELSIARAIMDQKCTKYAVSVRVILFV